MNDHRIPKHNIPVKVTLSDGSVVLGSVFLRQGQRILDMLCDDRMFFPLRSNAGVSLLNKNNVGRVDVMTFKEIADRQESLPGLNVKYLSNHSW